MTKLYKDARIEAVVPAIPFRPVWPISAPAFACGYYPREDYQRAFAQLNPVPANHTVAEAGLAGMLNFDFLTPPPSDLNLASALQTAYYSDAGAALFGDYAYVCTTFDHQTLLPAAAGSPGVYVQHGALGWDTGSISTNSFLSDGYCTFSVRPGRRYVVGLCSADALPGDFNSVNHGVLIDGQTVSTCEAGVPGRLFAWPVSDTTVFKVQRLNGVVTYFVDGRAFATTVDTDQNSRLIRMSACLYDGGSWVDGGAIAAFSVGALRTPSIAARGGVTASNKSGGATKLPALTAQALRSRITQYGARAVLPGPPRAKGFGAQRLNGAAARTPRLYVRGGVTGAGGYGGSVELPVATVNGGTSARYKSGGSSALPRLNAAGSGNNSAYTAMLPALAVRGGTSAGGSAALILPRPTARGGRNPGALVHGGGAAASLPVVMLRGGRVTSGGAPRLQAPSLRAGTKPFAVFDAYNRSFVELPALQALGYGKSGGVGRAALVLPALIARGMSPTQSGANVTLPLIAAYGFGAAPNTETMFSAAFVNAPFDGALQVVVVMNSAGAISAVIAGAVLQDGQVFTDILADTPAELQALLNAAMMTYINAAMELPLIYGSNPTGGSAAEDNQVWVVNLTNNATSTYENFAFNSFATLGDRHYGVRSEGLYLLEGDTDAGAPIRASVSFGKQDFGTPSKKNMTRAYVGASSTGVLLLKIITATGAEHIYTARASAAFQREQRFDVGRGIQANYFTFELFNKNGCDFELDSVAFFAADFNRRI